MILGVDEAGRGPIAGPVAVGVVAAPDGFDFHAVFPGLNDSKKLTEKKRERLFALLEAQAVSGSAGGTGSKSGAVRWHVELIGHDVIDTKGISHAVRSGVEKGVRKLLPKSESAQGKIWLDGLLKAPDGYEQETVVGGDALVPAIMLASVAAKVVRDRHMVALAAEHPAYGFERHKGYGTAAHYQAIRDFGLCAIHRRTYCPA